MIVEDLLPQEVVELGGVVEMCLSLKFCNDGA